jgi:hypothetical protein
MSCWSCNPYCGNCKPPKPKPVKCPVCGKFNFLDRMKGKNCIKCGEVLPEPPKPPVVDCLYSGLVCANPCGQYKKTTDDGTLYPCKLRTPPE